jgi:hypothetical protein
MDKQKKDKKFVKGSAKEAPFSENGEVVNLSLNVDHLQELLESNPELHKGGYVQLVLKKRAGGADQYGNTHMVYESTYQPKKKDAEAKKGAYTPDTDPVKEKKIVTKPASKSNDDLPF